MPRQRSPNRDRAKQLWLDSGKTRPLKDIAEEVGVSPEQVRKWKNEDGWDKKKKRNVTKPDKSNITIPKRSRGGQPGNKNSVGGGAPPGNTNSVKHGIYQEIHFDTLDEDEWAMIDAMRFDEVELYLIEQIQLLSVRERRLLRRIKEFQEAKGGITLESVVQRKLEIKGNVVVDNKQDQTETTTRTVGTFEVIDKLEAKLTQVQRVKAYCIAQLHKLRQEGSGEGNGNLDKLMSTIDAARKKWGGDDD